jgi:hypothetical protein
MYDEDKGDREDNRSSMSNAKLAEGGPTYPEAENPGKVNQPCVPWGAILERLEGKWSAAQRYC